MHAACRSQLELLPEAHRRGGQGVVDAGEVAVAEAAAVDVPAARDPGEAEAEGARGASGAPWPRRGGAFAAPPRRRAVPAPAARARRHARSGSSVGTTASAPPASDWARPPRLPPPPAVAAAAACLLRLGAAPSPTTSSSRRCLHLPPACSDWAPPLPATGRRPRCVGPALAPRPPPPAAASAPARPGLGSPCRRLLCSPKGEG